MAANCHWTVVNEPVLNQTFTDMSLLFTLGNIFFPSLNKVIALIMAMRVYLLMLNLKVD